jgi:archaellum component FlaC
VAIIRDDEEERLNRIDEILQQLQHQVNELKRLRDESARRLHESSGTREASADQRAKSPK